MANTPNVRFKGFTDDWEWRKLGEVTTSFSGGTPTVGVKEYYDGEIPFIRSGEINSDFTELFITEEGLNNSSAKFVSEGDILYALYGATSGEVARAKLKGAINQAILAIKPLPNYDAEYLSQWLRKSRQNIIETYLQGGQGNLSSAIVNGLLVDFPSYQEQHSIGIFFSGLDHLITLHQRKCDEVKQLKKFMLQKMFPKSGELIPEIRFAGFTDDWEQRKLIEVCDYVDYRGKTPTKTGAGIFLVTAKNVKNGYIDYECSKEFISKADYEEVMRRGKPEIGDVLITTEAPCGNVAQVDTANIALAQRIIKYRGYNNVVDNTYLKHYLLSPFFQKLLYEKSSGGTVQGIKGSILHQQNILYPVFDEQVKIGQYLDNLDHLITLHQRKHDELKEVKRFMLQNMFPQKG